MGEMADRVRSHIENVHWGRMWKILSTKKSDKQKDCLVGCFCVQNDKPGYVVEGSSI